MNTSELCFAILKASGYHWDRVAAVESAQFAVKDLLWGLNDPHYKVRLAVLRFHGNIIEPLTLFEMRYDASTAVRLEANKLLETIKQ